MDPRFARPLSPGGRRLAQPARSSTGTLMYPPSSDNYHAPTRTSSHSIHNPRSSAERITAPRISTKPYRDESLPVKKLREEYHDRPRRSTLEVDPIPARRPLGIVPTSSPSRSHPIITSAVENSSGPFLNSAHVRDGDPYYLLPASSSSRREHRRIYSADNEDSTRLSANDRENRERMQRGGYRSSGLGGGTRSRYRVNPPAARQSQEQDDREYGYEYTDPREQMYRDTTPRARPRNDSYSGRRPLSMTGMEDYLPRVPVVTRDTGPPVSMTTRGFDTLGRAGSTRQDYRPRESDSGAKDYIRSRPREDSDAGRSRVSAQAPVTLHHERNDTSHEKYDDLPEKSHHSSHKSNDIRKEIDSHDQRGSSNRAERGNDHAYDLDGKPRSHHRKSHHRDRERDRDDYDDTDRKERDEHRSDRQGHRSNVGEGLALGAAGVAAGVAAEGARRRHHRDKELREGNSEGHSDRLAVNQDPLASTSISEETSEEERRERRRRRRKEREAREQDARARDVEPVTIPVDTVARDQVPYERQPPAIAEPNEHADDSKRRRRHHRQHEQTSDEDSRDKDSSDDSSDNYRSARQVRVVTPSQDKPVEAPVKGILRQPREKFPEDPAPVREGVAPLKDAGKKGIPPNARWTKIDRKLVNPEALNQGNERFEERVDYVIVLRVLTKEEIQEYAQRTQEIRGTEALPDRVPTGKHN